MGERKPGKYRHEYKYTIDQMQNAVLKSTVRGIMKTDIHAGDREYYRVRSLYFDSPTDSCFYENEDGTGGERSKYRIRIYNADASRIVLEKKSKNRQMTLKQSCLIEEATCRQMMSGRGIQLSSDMTAEQRALIAEMQHKAMRPVVIVEYVRYPFIERNGNVRITFDENIVSSNDLSRFFDDYMISRPILPPGASVMEVKWDEFLPGYIKNHIHLDLLQWNSFSKYYLCRKYNTYGGIRI